MNQYISRARDHSKPPSYKRSFSTLGRKTAVLMGCISTEPWTAFALHLMSARLLFDPGCKQRYRFWSARLLSENVPVLCSASGHPQGLPEVARGCQLPRSIAMAFAFNFILFILFSYSIHLWTFSFCVESLFTFPFFVLNSKNNHSTSWAFTVYWLLFYTFYCFTGLKLSLLMPPSRCDRKWHLCSCQVKIKWLHVWMYTWGNTTWNH